MTICPATSEAIAEAATLLRGGALVAFPTETVYGLGADATNSLRGRRALMLPRDVRSFNPLIVHVPEAEAVAALAHLTPVARILAEGFWPGPLTLVLAKRPNRIIAELATAGLDTIAVRVPAHPIAQALLRAANLPIAAPSANRSGHVSPTTAAHVEADLGDRVAMILDGGATPVGLESTVIDATGAEPVVLRLGARHARGHRPRTRPAGGTGQRRSGASRPRPACWRATMRRGKRLRLEARRRCKNGEALLAFGRAVPDHAGPMVNLSAVGRSRGGGRQPVRRPARARRLGRRPASP